MAQIGPEREDFHADIGCFCCRTLKALRAYLYKGRSRIAPDRLESLSQGAFVAKPVEKCCLNCTTHFESVSSKVSEPLPTWCDLVATEEVVRLADITDIILLWPWREKSALRKGDRVEAAAAGAPTPEAVQVEASAENTENAQNLDFATSAWQS